MSAGRSFRSLFMAATCATAALGCYLVSLRVASERAKLEGVEEQIVTVQRDVRVLQTEIGTRGRLAQLERWNASALALSAPTATQFLNGSFELARLTRPQDRSDIGAPVVLASAPRVEAPRPVLEQPATDDSANAPPPSAAPTGTATASFTPRNLYNQASLKTGPAATSTTIGTREVPAKPAATPSAAGGKSKDRPVTAAKPAPKRSSDGPGLAAAKSTVPPGARTPPRAEPKKSVDKPALGAARPMTKPKQLAKADPLAPFGARSGGPTQKDSARQR